MSITGQVGHIALAKQTGFGTPNTTAASYRALKITGDSLVAANNMLVAEGEIGTGRDVSQAVPGGFSSAGAINGNLRVLSAAVLLEAALGSKTEVVGPPTTTTYAPADDLPFLSIEKRVGTTDPEQLVLRYTDAQVNTLNMSATSGGLSTFSAGVIAAGEQKIASALVTPAYAAASDDLLVFHGGRIRLADAGTASPLTNTANDATFQSMEVVINNNIDASEYTIRPSRFLRSLTEGIRSIEVNSTIVFDNANKYERYTYGATGRTAPGYNLYLGMVEFLLANWQIADTDGVSTAVPTGAPAAPQALQISIDRLAFGGFPVALSSGRIAVTTTARALKGTGNIIAAQTRPGVIGLT